ncbi:MAG: hypothetical protein AAB288_14095, partial [Acidobacteriota bacterium]
FEIWEVSTGKRCWSFDSVKAELRSVLISPDGTVLATWPTVENGTVELFETATGRKLATIPIKREWHAEFAPDSTCLLFQFVDDRKIAMIDVTSGRILWDAASTNLSLARFIDSGTVIRQVDESGPLDILDAQSGKVKYRLFWSTNSYVAFTPDRSWGVFSGYPSAGRQLAFWEAWLEKWLPKMADDGNATVIVADLKAGCVRFCLRLPKVDQYYLSEDGTTLVTIDRDSSRVSGTKGALIQAWDVRRYCARIWGWSGAIILGACLLLLRRWRLKRVNKTCASTANMAPSAEKLT